MANDTLTMPHNRDAEMALLGCLIIDNEIASDIIEKLDEDDFYQDTHKTILRGMHAVFAARKPIDLVTLSDELDAQGELTKVGGIAYLTELAEIMPSAANYASYYEIVKRDSTNRKLIRASRRIIENSMAGNTAGDAIRFAEKSVYDISEQADNGSLKAMSEEGIVDQVMQKFQNLQANPDAFRGIPTGFKHFDRITNGLQNSDLIILAARPGMGKTSFAMNIVEHAAIVGKKVCAVFSLEMPRLQIVQRLLCANANVSMAKALSGQLNKDDWNDLMDAGDRLKKAKIFIDDSSRVTAPEILSKCRRLKATLGSIDLIMIDYIQLMSGAAKTVATSEGGKTVARTTSPENRTLEIASITRELKIMAKELNVPVIALSQLRRMQTKEPQLSDLRESGAIEQDADIVLFINRPEATATKDEILKGKVIKGAAELVIAKHRNGAQGRVQLHFNGESTKFIDVEDQNMPTEEPKYGKKPKSIEDDVEKAVYGSDVPPPEEEQGEDGQDGYDGDMPPFD